MAAHLKRRPPRGGATGTRGVTGARFRPGLLGSGWRAAFGTWDAHFRYGVCGCWGRGPGLGVRKVRGAVGSGPRVGVGSFGALEAVAQSFPTRAALPPVPCSLSGSGRPGGRPAWRPLPGRAQWLSGYGGAPRLCLHFADGSAGEERGRAVGRGGERPGLRRGEVWRRGCAWPRILAAAPLWGFCLGGTNS